MNMDDWIGSKIHILVFLLDHWGFLRSMDVESSSALRNGAQEVFMAHFVYSSQCPAQGGDGKKGQSEELGKSSRALPAPRGETLDGSLIL